MKFGIFQGKKVEDFGAVRFCQGLSWPIFCFLSKKYENKN